MTSAPHHQTFGQQQQPHTVIIARGEKVRHFTISARLAGVSGALAIALFVGCASTACYLMLQDDLRASATDTQLKLQRSYEERIASLRAQLDRVVSRQMIDQQAVESKVDALIGQQVELSARYDKLQPLLDRARDNGLITAAIPVPQANPAREAAGPVAPTPEVRPLSFLDGLPNAALARFDLVDHTSAAVPLALRGDADVRETRPQTGISHDLIQQIGQSIDSVEHGQIANLASLAEKARDKAGSIATALRSEGIALPEGLQQAAGGEGGPFVAVALDQRFDARFQELDRALTELQLLKQKTLRLPLAAPVDSRLVSSAFGVRSDPFLGESAMHTGIDFVASSGSTVDATAGGTVTQAGYNGGYGNMVEIDHGGGMVTRYGHLSSIAVSVGDSVAAGDVIGRVGSTGRSTGPHLHYEVRRDGNPIDPSRFLRAGRKLDAVI